MSWRCCCPGVVDVPAARPGRAVGKVLYSHILCCCCPGVVDVPAARAGRGRPVGAGPDLGGAHRRRGDTLPLRGSQRHGAGTGRSQTLPVQNAGILKLKNSYLVPFLNSTVLKH